MIAVFIRTIGVLGMASLQILSVRYAQDAYFVSQAKQWSSSIGQTVKMLVLLSKMVDQCGST